MVLSRQRIKRKANTLDELFKNQSSQGRQRNTDEDQDLALALKLSKEEQVNEQKRILEQLSRLSQKANKRQRTSTPKKKRLIRHDTEDEDEEESNFTNKTDEDQWFQTVSTRPQPNLRQEKASKKSNIPIKKEQQEKSSILLDLEDASEWLEVKEEGSKKEEISLEVDDLDAFLDQENQGQFEVDDLDDYLQQSQTDSVILVERDEEGGMSSHMDHACKSDMISDSDDCSVIDLINPQPDNNTISEEEDDDGYLSPLEGFSSIQEDNENDASNPFVAQLQRPVPQKRSATKKKATPKPGKKRYSKNKWMFKRKKKL